MEELAAPIAEGLHLPTLRLLPGHTPLLAVGRPVRIREGRLQEGAVPDVRVAVEPLELLAAAQALTSWQATIPTAQRSARTVGATVCPAGRFAGGLHVL
jgi:hypothetical protein